MKIRHKRDHAAARRAAYPPIGDQLDAVAALATALRDGGVALPPKVAAWLDQVAEVKRQYPK